jgi:PAS domain S-box-containing protein
VLPPAVADALEPHYRAALAGEERAFTARQGDRVYACEAVPVRDAAGGVIAAMVLSRDLSERHEAEAGLRREVELRTALLESSADCVKLLDPAGRLEAINAAGVRLLEAPSEDSLLGRELAGLWPPEGAARMREAVAAALGGGVGRFQGFCPTVRGTLKWWDVSVSPVRDETGAVTRLLCVTRDGTAAMRAAAALRTSEARLSGIIGSAMDAILTTDADQRVVLANAAAERVFGYAAEELLGQSLDALIPERYRAEHRREVARFADDGTTPRAMGRPGALSHVGLAGLRRDGSEFPIEASISQVATDEGPVLHGDPARRHRAPRGGGGARAARGAAPAGPEDGGGRAARRRDRARLQQPAHDHQREPRFVAEDLPRGSGRTTGAGGPGGGRRRHRARGHAGAPAPDVQPQGARGRAVRPRGRGGARRGAAPPAVIGEEIALALHLDDGGTVVHADPGQLEQVLMNLAVNARDAMRTPRHGHPGTGGTLEIEVAPVTLGAGEAARGTGSGRDRTCGCGCATRARDGRRDAGARLRAVLHHEGRGHRHGARARDGLRHRAPGRRRHPRRERAGAGRHLHDPAAGRRRRRAPAPPRSPPPVSDRAPSPGTTVLLVEDEEPVRATGRRMLERAGYTVLEARNGRDALRVWQTHRATVRAVVTDLRMPEMDGRDLAAHLRQGRAGSPDRLRVRLRERGCRRPRPARAARHLPAEAVHRRGAARGARAVLRDGAAGVVP